MHKSMVVVVGSLSLSGTEKIPEVNRSVRQPCRMGCPLVSGIESAPSDISRNRSSSGPLETARGTRIGGSEAGTKVARRNFRPNPLFWLSFSFLCLFSPFYAQDSPSRFTSNILLVSNASPRPTYHSAFTSLRMTAMIAFFFTPPSRTTFLLYQVFTIKSF